MDVQPKIITIPGITVEELELDFKLEQEFSRLNDEDLWEDLQVYADMLRS